MRIFDVPLWAHWSFDTFERNFHDSGGQLMGRVAVAWLAQIILLSVSHFSYHPKKA